MSVPNQAAPAASPAAPPSNDEAIGNIARDFLADIDRDQPTDQLDPNVREEPVAEAPQEAPTEEAEAPEAETPTPEPDVSLVEVDIDGEKFSIPEKVKHRVMADKDYRQKTMEVAATRKTLEQLTATAQKVSEQARNLAPLHAQLHQMDAHANYLRSQLRSPELLADPLSYNRVQGELGILLNDMNHYAQNVKQQTDQFEAQQQRLRADKLALEAPKLFEEFPELQKREAQEKLAKYAEDAGLPPEAMDFMNYSAAATKLLHKAALYDQIVRDQATAQAKLKKQVAALPPTATKGRAADPAAQNQRAMDQWKKSGGHWKDMPSPLLRGK